MIELVANMKNFKTGYKFMFTTLKSFVLHVRRAVLMKRGYTFVLLTCPKSACPEKGLLSVVDNKSRESQARGPLTVIPDVFFREDF